MSELGSAKRKRKLTELHLDEINEIIALRGKIPQTALGKKYGIEQTDVSQIQRMQKGKLLRPDEKRMKDVELVVPIAYGTIAFWLGKKADQEHSHKWTVYVRAVNNEDLTRVVRKVIFQLHPSFKNPTRMIEKAPFELTETGWGEFDIGITLIFQSDIGEMPIEFFHHLNLYPEDDNNQQILTKKPTVSEKYDELVFIEPTDSFYNRTVSSSMAQTFSRSSPLSSSPLPKSPSTEMEMEDKQSKSGDTKNHPLVNLFKVYSEEEEVEKIKAARKDVLSKINALQRKLNIS